MDHAQTANHWAGQYDSRMFQRREWIGHPLASARLKQIMSGHATHAAWFVETQMRTKPVPRALGIGVGVATHELRLIESGVIDHFDFYDISQAGLDIAKATATEMGIVSKVSFVCADINSVDLLAEKYGIITFMASLHHIEKLSDTLLQCNKALTPGGVLWAFEYVGPDRFEYPDEHADIARKIYKLLDRDMHLPGEPDLKFPSPADVVAVDPTEAIHSSEILPTMRTIWPDVEVHGQYGSLLFMLMWCLNYNSIYDDPKCFALYGELVELETKLVDAGALPHYFVNAIARKTERIPSKVGRLAQMIRSRLR